MLMRNISATVPSGEQCYDLHSAALSHAPKLLICFCSLKTKDRLKTTRNLFLHPPLIFLVLLFQSFTILFRANVVAILCRIAFKKWLQTIAKFSSNEIADMPLNTTHRFSMLLSCREGCCLKHDKWYVETESSWIAAVPKNRIQISNSTHGNHQSRLNIGCCWRVF